MYVSDVNLEVIDGQPYFTAHLTGDPFRGDRAWHLPYRAHKICTSAETGEVLEHCFLVETGEWSEDGETAPTYSIYSVEKHQVIKHNFDDDKVYNNWDFAYRYFVDEFGSGSVHNVKPEGVENNLTSFDRFC